MTRRLLSPLIGMAMLVCAAVVVGTCSGCAKIGDVPEIDTAAPPPPVPSPVQTWTNDAELGAAVTGLDAATIQAIGAVTWTTCGATELAGGNMVFRAGEGAPNGEIRFEIPGQPEPVLLLAGDGKIYVRGKEAADDALVVAAFKAWVAESYHRQALEREK